MEPAVPVARVVHEVLQDRAGLQREAGHVGVGQLAVPAVAPRLAEAVAHDEVAAARRRRAVHVPHDQHAVHALPVVLRGQSGLRLLRLRERERLAVASLEKAHRHAHGHRTPPVHARENAADLVHVVRRGQQVESGEDPVLLRVVVRPRRMRAALRRPEQRRGGYARVRPERIATRPPVLQHVETRPEQAALHRLVPRPHRLLELREVRLHHGRVDAPVRVRHHPQLEQFRVERVLEGGIKRLARAQMREIALDRRALDLLRDGEEVLHAEAHLAVLVVLQHRRDGVRHARAAQRLLVDGRHLRDEGRGGRHVARAGRRPVAAVPKGAEELGLLRRKDMGGRGHLRRRGAVPSPCRRPGGGATRQCP